MHANVYRLSADCAWENIGGGSISIGAEKKPVDHLSGTFAMQLDDAYCLSLNINCAGQYSFKTNPVLPEPEIAVSTTEFLQEFQCIELNKEIPVALMVYDNGSSMRVCTLQDYFSPEKFSGIDLVQVVTLEFSDKEF